jgi:cardiolipin synthase (CMP-forming)
VKPEYIPNLLCVARMLLVPPLVWLLAHAQYRVAVSLFLLAGASDALDGFLAKRYGWRTQLGGLLDPAADKLLLSSVFLTLGFVRVVPPWLVAVVVARDLVIVAGAVAYRVLIGRFAWRARPVSKVNTAAQLAFVLAALLRAAFGLPSAGVLQLLGAVVVTTTLLSGADYVWSWGKRAWLVRQGEAA